MLKYLRTKHDKKGFTLVEVIIVLVILAILAAVIIPSLTGYIDRANKSKYMLSAKNCMNAMQVELSEMYAERGELADLTNIAGTSGSNHDVSFIGTDFAREVLTTADDDPYMLIFGLGDYEKYIDTDPQLAYKVFFVAYWPDKNVDPIFFNGSEWTDKYPWKGSGQNTFKVDGKDILLQFYFVTGPRAKDTSGNWNEIKGYLNIT